jgi:uncharacterized repeat protein (TIGR01451 family)
VGRKEADLRVSGYFVLFFLESRFMSNLNLKGYLAVATVALYGVVYSTSVLAVGTDADTDIDNFATVDYRVGGFSQPPVVSPTTSFKVDQVVDLTVAEADGAETSVVPNETGAIARFTVTNTGNEVQDFGLSVNNVATGIFGVTDNFDPSAFTIVIDANGDDVYDVGDTVANFIDELSADDLNPDPLLDNVVSVFVLANIPIAQVPGDGANIELVAEAREGGTATVQGIVQAETGGANTDGLEIVWSNNTAADDDAYLVGALPTLAATKSSEVLSDPLLNVFPNALAIPGAFVEYTVTVTNTGTTAATNLSVSDTLQGELTFETGTYNGSTADVEITVGAGPATYCIAEPGGTDTNLDGCVLTGSILTVATAGMTADEVANTPNNVVVVRFQVTINN